MLRSRGASTERGFSAGLLGDSRSPHSRTPLCLPGRRGVAAPRELVLDTAAGRGQGDCQKHLFSIGRADSYINA